MHCSVCCTRHSLSAVMADLCGWKIDLCEPARRLFYRPRPKLRSARRVNCSASGGGVRAIAWIDAAKANMPWQGFCITGDAVRAMAPSSARSTCASPAPIRDCLHPDAPTPPPRSPRERGEGRAGLLEFRLQPAQLGVEHYLAHATMRASAHHRVKLRSL